MNVRALALAVAILISPVAAPLAVSGLESPELLGFWYSWGYTRVNGQKVLSYTATNLTLHVSGQSADLTEIDDVVDFHAHAASPGPDPYPVANGTNPFPYPQFSAIYDSRRTQLHQVVEVRFLRVFEFTDANGDGAYSSGEPVLSEVSLGTPSQRYLDAVLRPLHSLGTLDLSVRTHYPDTCCGEAWEGWAIPPVEQGDVEGLSSSIAYLENPGAMNLTVTGNQWFASRTLQGVDVTPTTVKLDFQIVDYNFLATDSRLALELNLTTFAQAPASDWAVIPWPQGQGLRAVAGNSSATFAWSGEALADGVLRPVVGTTVPVDPLSNLVYLSYPAASRIEHDPTVGIEDRRLVLPANDTGPPDGMSSSPAWIAFAATLLVATGAVYAVERRKR